MPAVDLLGSVTLLRPCRPSLPFLLSIPLFNPMDVPAPFIHADFMLESPAARTLYHTYAADLPIIDYHCHLPPELIASNHRFENLSEIWLGGDHYKWRAMRTNGVPERLITGDASDREKFQAWAETVPKCLRNPLYHWTHLELNRPFGISNRLLDGSTAESVWADCNSQLGHDGLTTQVIMTRMNVVAVCTTDDPIDSLEHHVAVARQQQVASATPRTAHQPFTCQVRPTWRPDKGMAVDDPLSFNAWVDQLAAVSNTDICDMHSYRTALAKRHAFFHAAGCRLSDHGLDTVYADHYTDVQIGAIFSKVRSGQRLSVEESRRFKSCMLHEGAVMDHAAGWVQQFHIGALRNNNRRLFAALGPDRGFDSIGDWNYAEPLSRFLDRLDSDNRLTKTILYNLNPKENEMLATMIGNFQDGSVPGKVQFGSGWWFLDQLDGMSRQLDALSSLSLLSRFIGMLTDSRSFLSYTRHEYFRRLLCNTLGDEINRGLLPNDLRLIGEMVRDIGYRNAAGYFDFGLPAEPQKVR